MKNPYMEAAVAVRKLFADGADPNTGDVAKAICDSIRKANEDNDREQRVSECADATGYGPEFGRAFR